ncbi:hypothetical protein Q1695_010299 [Nippostrongylus brasiliensis]|nr:hypothetical protein Q1695_010299 [Nippostrongylus brasiliensis]
MAFRRLQSTMTKLRGDPELLQQYHETFNYQLSHGIIEEVDDSAATKGIRVHYLAHHAVVTPHKETTKLRVVFDASAHRQGVHSLNDLLHKGAPMLPPLNDILLRFRIGDVALVSDVEKAFLQIRLPKLTVTGIIPQSEEYLRKSQHEPETVSTQQRGRERFHRNGRP